VDTGAVCAAGHDADDAGAAAGTGFDVHIVRPEELDLMAGFLTLQEDFFKEYVRVGHFSAERQG
jgi:hypothetical protein